MGMLKNDASSATGLQATYIIGTRLILGKLYFTYSQLTIKMKTRLPTSGTWWTDDYINFLVENQLNGISSSQLAVAAIISRHHTAANMRTLPLLVWEILV